jgi:hypothetical protein
MSEPVTFPGPLRRVLLIRPAEASDLGYEPRGQYFVLGLSCGHELVSTEPAVDGSPFRRCLRCGEEESVAVSLPMRWESRVEEMSDPYFLEANRREAARRERLRAARRDRVASERTRRQQVGR